MHTSNGPIHTILTVENENKTTMMMKKKNEAKKDHRAPTAHALYSLIYTLQTTYTCISGNRHSMYEPVALRVLFRFRVCVSVWIVCTLVQRLP